MRSFEQQSDDFMQALEDARLQGGEVILPCRAEDPEVFFPEKENKYTTRQAKEICYTCPFVVEYLNGALQRREASGVWGGATTRERNAMLKKRSGKSAA